MAHRLTRRGFLRRTAIGLGSASCLAATTAARAAPKGTAGFTPRFSICNETFAGWPFEKACGLTAEAGYQGIEIAPFTLSPDVRKISPQRRREIHRQASSLFVSFAHDRSFSLALRLLANASRCSSASANS